MKIMNKLPEWIVFFIITLICMNQTCMNQAQTYNPSEEFKKGTIFIHQGNFLMTSSHWTLVNDVHFEHFEWQIQSLTQSIATLENMIIQREQAHEDKKDAFKWRLPTNGFNLLQSSFLNYKRSYYELKSLITLPDSTKEKRGLIDFGGKALKFLFGTATSDDIETLNEEVSQLKQVNRGIIHLLRSQATLLNDTLKISKNNRQQIHVLAQRQQTFEGLMKMYRYNLAFEIIMRTVEFSLQEFHMQLIEMREAIDVLEQNKLSTYFIPREVILNTLKEIQLQLPEGYSLIEPVKVDTLFRYYQWITTIAVALPGKLRIFAKIPLITPSGYFDTYEILELPTYIPNLKACAYFQTKYPIIALSMDRQSYMLLEQHELTVCQVSQFAICSPNVPIYRAPQQSCEYSLFMGNDQKVKNLCSRRIVHHYSPIFKRVDKQGTWVFSTPTPLTLAIKCSTKQRRAISPPSTISKLNNTGLIRLPSACIGYLPGIILTSHFHMTSTIQTNMAPTFVIPPIEDIINKTEIQLIKKQVLEPNILETSTVKSDLDIKLADRSNEQVTYDLDQLLKENQPTPRVQGIPHSIIWIILGCFCLSLTFIGAFYAIQYRLWKRKLQSSLTRNQTQEILLEEVSLDPMPTTSVESNTPVETNNQASTTKPKQTPKRTFRKPFRL